MLRSSGYAFRHAGAAAFVLFLAATAASWASQPARWVAVSKTASAITGDARFTATEITFANGSRLSIAYLKSVSGRVSFVGDTHAKDRADLYRVLSRADVLLSGRNMLCGSKPTYVSVMTVRESIGDAAYLTVYRGSTEPAGTPDDDICAGYTYEVSP